MPCNELLYSLLYTVHPNVLNPCICKTMCKTKRLQGLSIVATRTTSIGYHPHNGVFGSVNLIFGTYEKKGGKSLKTIHWSMKMELTNDNNGIVLAANNDVRTSFVTKSGYIGAFDANNPREC